MSFVKIIMGSPHGGGGYENAYMLITSHTIFRLWVHNKSIKLYRKLQNSKVFIFIISEITENLEGQNHGE